MKKNLRCEKTSETCGGKTILVIVGQRLNLVSQMFDGLGIFGFEYDMVLI